MAWQWGGNMAACVLPFQRQGAGQRWGEPAENSQTNSLERHQRQGTQTQHRGEWKCHLGDEAGVDQGIRKVTSGNLLLLPISSL